MVFFELLYYISDIVNNIIKSEKLNYILNYVNIFYVTISSILLIFIIIKYNKLKGFKKGILKMFKKN